MIIGVMSDTHGNRRLMHDVANLMKAKYHVELIIHVGDDYPDAEELAMVGHTVAMVPGLWCDAYFDGRVPNRLFLTCDDVTISAAHADKDIGARELSAAIVLTGHTHVAKIEKAGRSLHVNPGHLKHPKLDRGHRPSFAIIETAPETVSVTVFELDASPRIQVTVQRHEIG